jgi:hypothetical protein
MAMTMLDLGYDMVYMDLDKKVHKMHNLKRYLELPGERVELLTLGSTLIEKGTLKARVQNMKVAPKKQPQGYLEFIGMMSDLEIKDEAYFKNKVSVIDSGTRLFEHLKRLILYFQGRAALEIQDWGLILTNLEELFETFFSLPFEHNILICHDQIEKDDNTGITEVLPLIDGQMKQKAGGYVEECYYFSPDITTKGANYRILTRPLGRVKSARTSRDLQTYEPADFSKIFKEEYHGR